MAIYIEEFERFKDGLTYTIMFDSNGDIKRATIYVDEMESGLCDGDIDVTPYIAKDPYWVKRVLEHLDKLQDIKREHMLFKLHKEFYND